MAATEKRKCFECARRVEIEQTHLVRRSAGGSYRTAARMIPTTICTECVLDLGPRRSPGAMLVGAERWSAASIEWLAWGLLTPARH